MSTTTIRIPNELKEKVARVAERTGKTPHSFILEAISEKAELEERRANFIETAERRYDSIVASGMTIPWAQMRKYLERRTAGEAVVRPKPRRLAP
jgi:predicted transcriptional regulator